MRETIGYHHTEPGRTTAAPAALGHRLCSRTCGPGGKRAGVRRGPPQLCDDVLKMRDRVFIVWPRHRQAVGVLRAGGVLDRATGGGATDRAAPALAMSARPGTSSVGGICQLSAAQQAHYPTTPPGKDNPNAVAILTYYDSAPHYISGIGRYVLGPAEMNGPVVKTATAVFDRQVGSWEVNITFTSAGSAEFNRYAAQHYACYEKDPTNPPYCALQAIEINGVVETAPAIEAGSFPGGATIAGSFSGPFTKAQAESVASSVRTASKFAGRPA